MQAAKRRRVELDLRGTYADPGHSTFNPQQDHAQYLRGVPGYGNGHGIGSAAPSDFSLEGSSSTDLADRTGSTAALAATSTSGQQWDAPPYTDAYPDATTFPQQQQPYFSGYSQQSTDPSTYNSPWPPQSQADGFGHQGSNYGASTAATMPYFGAAETGVMNANGNFDNTVAASLQGFGQEVEPPADYSYGGSDGGVQAVSVPPEESSSMIFDDASMQLKNQSLPILENLATQLIQTIAKAGLPQIQEILSGSDTEEGQAYNALINLFEQTRKVYSRETPFIDAIAIQMFQPNQQEIIRKANIVTFISSILGAHDVSFFHLNEFFMETFVPLGHRLLKWQGAIYLDLKTQAYISALINSDGNPSAMLDELFPPDLDAQILTRHPDAPSLSPSEQDFIDRCRARKSYLLAEGNASTALKELPKKYQWTEFVREFASGISKNVEAIMNTSFRAQNSSNERRNTVTNDLTLDNTLASFNSSDTTTTTIPTRKPTLPPHPSTTAPTASSNTIRQPWTKAEEDALLSGLEKVSGPHWSQILALYGRGGSVSEVLKDRNQVQLKDKARNLKLGYLKVGRPVPESLRGVTGELRTRGGTGARAALGAADGGVGDGEEEEEPGTGRTRGRTKKGS